MFSESHPAFRPPILLREQQCCKVRNHTGFDPRSLDQHSAKPLASSPGSGSPGGILCVIDAVWGLVNWCHKPYSCADHMDMARCSVWSYLVISRAGNDLWIFATFGGNLRQAQWHKQWAQNDGPMPATAEVFKPGISTWISFKGFELISGRDSKQKFRVDDAIPSRKTQCCSQLQGVTPATEDFTIFFPLSNKPDNIHWQGAWCNTATANLTFALSHLSQQKPYGCAKQMSS